MSNRRWFQVHLSTAIVLMFVAGILIWLNIYANDSEISGTEQGYVVFSSHGWPMKCLVVGQYPEIWFYRWSWKYVVLNSIFALAILCLTALILKLRIRRREARRP